MHRGELSSHRDSRHRYSEVCGKIPDRTGGSCIDVEISRRPFLSFSKGEGLRGVRGVWTFYVFIHSPFTPLKHAATCCCHSARRRVKMPVNIAAKCTTTSDRACVTVRTFDRDRGEKEEGKKETKPPPGIRPLLRAVPELRRPDPGAAALAGETGRAGVAAELETVYRPVQPEPEQVPGEAQVSSMLLVAPARRHGSTATKPWTTRAIKKT